jgi:adenylate cyclase
MVFRFHTFLFADLVGFTGFTARHGDERAADLAVSFQERVCTLSAMLGCQVVKTIGDGVMVRSDNGDAAIKLARGILDLVADPGFPLVRVGLDTGPAVERNGDWFGSTVNTAARVTAAADAGELLVTERTREACAGASRVELRERGVHELEGLPAHALYGQARSSQSAGRERRRARRRGQPARAEAA